MPAAHTSGAFGRVLDTSALAQATTGKSIYARTLIELALASGANTLLIPVTAYIQALAEIPQDLRWTPMLLTTSPGVHLDLIEDREKAHEIADLGASDPALAHVAWCALQYGWPLVTDRGPELLRISPDLHIEALP
ncbi:hypothetical protein EDD27_7864 [Nonomuraea polychroma]|uniref:PIN domain-containing protein n=1 Tax=Nonomuraea polychroma TaxID=46176 RepID=A0A438MH23_9ACTN|nr:hypothetical protein [Nonomuraea polychroma]RVX45087.1 hypothetical protein EDD27_7864 [Nonomuraea polychroma]